jgi:hypothetical protein
MSKSTVAVIGGGPYGLACTAHLRAAGLETHLLGPRMQFWERHMPQGMFLRPPWQASSISDPRGSLTLDAYQSAHGETLSRPIPLCEQGLHTVDLGRTDLGHDSLRAFKLMWGAQERRLQYTELGEQTVARRSTQPPRGMRLPIRRSPPILSRGLGEPLYRHVG